MTAGAANNVDHILPDQPLRQWVLTLPFELRARLAYDGELLGAVSRVFVDSVLGWYRRPHARPRGERRQERRRYRGAARLERFPPEPPLPHPRLGRRVRRTARRRASLPRPALPHQHRRRRRAPDAPRFAGSHPARGRRSGATDPQAPVQRRDLRHRHGPAVARGALAASVPPPRFNTVRYAGVLAANSKWRSRVSASRRIRPCSRPPADHRGSRAGSSAASWGSHSRRSCSRRIDARSRRPGSASAAVGSAKTGRGRLQPAATETPAEQDPRRRLPAEDGTVTGGSKEEGVHATYAPFRRSARACVGSRAPVEARRGPRLPARPRRCRPARPRRCPPTLPCRCPTRPGGRSRPATYRRTWREPSVAEARRSSSRERVVCTRRAAWKCTDACAADNGDARRAGQVANGVVRIAGQFAVRVDAPRAGYRVNSRHREMARNVLKGSAL